VSWEIIHGNCLEVMRSLDSVDCIITDPPYSAQVHAGHRVEGADGGDRRELTYANWAPEQVRDFAATAADVCSGWIFALSCHRLLPAYRTAYEAVGLTAFQPVPCVITGMTCRFAGDGPSSWAVYANVARPKTLSKWGTLPGAYVGPCIHSRKQWIGGKPLWLMRALVRDYSRPGDTILDPCCGGGTTGVAAIEAGRNFIGADIDPEAVRVSRERCAKTEAQPDLLIASPKPKQMDLA